jgi:sigma-E factor negative regulatory protein RseA
MNESKLEAISALVDGEAAPAGMDAVAELVREAESRRYWGRYHLISDCIRSHLPRRIDKGLAGRIEAALRDEPTVLAPEPAAHSWLRPLAGLAVAASVATLAVVAVRMDRNAVDAPSVTQVASAGTAQVASQGRVRLAAGSDAGGPARAQTTPGRMNARLNRYLVNYNEYRTNAAVQGMIPYVRIVAHDEDK